MITICVFHAYLFFFSKASNSAWVTFPELGTLFLNLLFGTQRTPE
jgi:hypothetical protein